MKGKELLYLLGLRPKPRTYGHRLRVFDLPDDGRVEYAQWLHPKEPEKTITAAGMRELRRYLGPGDVAGAVGDVGGEGQRAPGQEEKKRMSAGHPRHYTGECPRPAHRCAPVSFYCCFLRSLARCTCMD